MAWSHSKNMCVTPRILAYHRVEAESDIYCIIIVCVYVLLAGGIYGKNIISNNKYRELNVLG